MGGRGEVPPSPLPPHRPPSHTCVAYLGREDTNDTKGISPRAHVVHGLERGGHQVQPVDLGGVTIGPRASAERRVELDLGGRGEGGG
jgi:hypothetical protein